MPWHVEEDHADCSGWAVVKDSDDSVVGCHDTKQDALDHLAALNANVSERAAMRRTPVRRGFDAVVLNVDRARQALVNGEPEGRVVFEVAIFGEPDTYVPYGATQRQVIDKGAFAAWIAANDFEARPINHFVDHGEIGYGMVSDRLKIGKGIDFEERASGLVVTTLYNLELDEAKNALSRLVFNPTAAQFSFSNNPDEITYRGSDGFEHVKEFPSGVMETSQVAFGAQALTNLVEARNAQGGPKTMTTTARGVSLDELPERLREAWWKNHSGMTWVVECWADDERRAAGWVIAYQDGAYWQVRWSLDEDEALVWDDDTRKEVESAWVPKGGKTAIRTAEGFLRAGTIGGEDAGRIRAAADEALQPHRDLAELYRGMLDTAVAPA
jgi:hypothetical protein